MLIQLIIEEDIRRAIVFTRTKHGANRLVGQLEADDIPADAIHGNKSQTARTNALRAFKRGNVDVLVKVPGLRDEAFEDQILREQHPKVLLRPPAPPTPAGFSEKLAQGMVAELWHLHGWWYAPDHLHHLPQLGSRG